MKQGLKAQQVHRVRLVVQGQLDRKDQQARPGNKAKLARRALQENKDLPVRRAQRA